MLFLDLSSAIAVLATESETCYLFGGIRYCNARGVALDKLSDIFGQFSDNGPIYIAPFTRHLLPRVTYGSLQNDTHCILIRYNSSFLLLNLKWILLITFQSASYQLSSYLFNGKNGDFIVIYRKLSV